MAGAGAGGLVERQEWSFRAILHCFPRCRCRLPPWWHGVGDRSNSTTEAIPATATEPGTLQQGFFNRLPGYHTSCRLGGWHFPWPDGDWFDLLTKTLLIWTFEGAEPWIEVWADQAGELHLIERITWTTPGHNS